MTEPPAIDNLPLSLQEFGGTIETGGALAPSEEVVAAFFDLDGAGLALKASQFDLNEEVTRIVNIVRRTDDDKVELTALRQLRAVLTSIATATGLIGGRQELVGERVTDDGTVRIKATTNLVMSRMRSRPTVPLITASQEKPDDPSEHNPPNRRPYVAIDPRYRGPADDPTPPTVADDSAGGAGQDADESVGDPQ